MNAIQKFIEAEHKYLDLKEIDYKEYEQTIAPLRDVECVVRCPDCLFNKNCISTENGIEHDGFCKWGKRKDGDGDA